MKELYLWWKYGRAHEHECDNDIKTFYDFNRMEALDDKDDAQLMRLVKVRGFMWT